MRKQFVRFALVGLVLALVSGPAFAQDTSSISGTVLDASGGAVPGATVTAKNDATGATLVVVTGANGNYAIPAVSTGTYTVTVTLDGFKTSIISDVVVSAGILAAVNATLEVGELTETVVVEGAAELVQTQAPTVSSRISVDEITNLPLSSRNVLNFVVNLPGASTPGGSRATTISGLSQGSINITLDGINAQDNTLKTTDGFFAIISPRLDAIEEVTVSQAAQTSDASGGGAVNIAFVTRSGSNAYTGSIYHYWQNDMLNENTYFNIRDGVDKPALNLNQPGGRVGGPIVIPGLFDGHNRAFFFFNFEQFRRPGEVTRNRTIMSAASQSGIFQYGTNDDLSIDLMALAASRGLPSTFDPTIVALLADIRAATGTTGVVLPIPGDPDIERYSFNNPQKALFQYPTVRIDWNLSERHRLSSSINWQYYSSSPDTLNGRDPQFPGGLNADQDSFRIGFSNSLRSTLGPNLVNELRVGGSGAPVTFFPQNENGAARWDGPLFNEKGHRLGINTARINNASISPNYQARNAYTWLIQDTVNWQVGAHGVNFGGSFDEVIVWLDSQNNVATINFDQVTGTLGDTVFGSSANIPGGSSTDRNNAEDLYSVLVGSVSAINGEARINGDTGEYVYMGLSHQEGKLRTYSFWAQDAWRPRADLTINLGLRYVIQTPFQALNDSYSRTTMEDIWGISGFNPACDVSNIHANLDNCNIFRPGFQPGKAESQYYLLEKGQDIFEMDMDNLAPSVGIAWTPSKDTGWLASFLGQPGDTVFRAGWSRSFQRNGMTDFTGRIDDNPGLIRSDAGDRNDGLGNIFPDPNDDWLLLRNGDLTPAPFPLTREYPLTDTQTSDIAWFDPNLQVPGADSYSAGYQRAVSRNMAVEVRYVGTRSRDLWSNINLNEVNIFENGVLNEFLLAQQNLQANIAAGRGGTFAYMGAGTGTSPLPISLAYFRGTPAAQAGDASLYTSSNFRSTTYLNPLSMRDPNVQSFATALDSSSSNRSRALAAGLPANFLIVNPNKIGGAEIQSNRGFTRYNSVQVELRRRMANGFQLNASYVFGRAWLSDFYSLRVPGKISLDTGGEGGIHHALKFQWLFELPFGQGRRWGSNAGPVMDRIIGGWQVHGIGRIQSGEIVDYGNVRLVGMTHDELQAAFGIYRSADGTIEFLPSDIIENTIKAFNDSPTSADGYSSQGPPEGRYLAPASGPDCLETISSGYGDCGERVVELNGPMFKNMDISVVKAVPLKGRVRAEFRIEMLNAFNWVNFNPFASTSTNRGSWDATGLVGNARIVQLVSRVSW